MQFYEIYDQPRSQAIDDLIEASPYCQLLTRNPDGLPHCGIFNPIRYQDRFVVHLNRHDEQIRDILAYPQATVSFMDFLALIPSYWIDAEDGGAATSYYRYAEFLCQAKVVDSPAAMIPYLKHMMDRFQPEGHFAPLTPDQAPYRQTLKMIAIVELVPMSARTKWKLGQNRPLAVRHRVVRALRERGLPGDLRAADLMGDLMGDTRLN